MNDELAETMTGPFVASRFAADLDRLFYAMLAVCSIAALAISFLIVLFCLRYRRGRRADRRSNQANAKWLEIAWIGLPLLTFIVFFFWGARLYLDYQRLPEDPLTIRVVASQWMWKFYHPGGQREINTLHVPAGQPVLLRMASEDVIHSFFVPGFRVKQDAVPGRYTRVAFQVSEPGSYRLFCAEYCGTEHSRMRGRVTVMPADEYDRWLNEQVATASLPLAGARLFGQQGCDECHSQTDTPQAPTLLGLAGSAVTLRSGATVTADSAYLRDAIALPEKHVVAGYDPIMPGYGAQLSEEELLQLVSYIKSLPSAQAPDSPRESSP